MLSGIENIINWGLEGIYVTETRLSKVDGLNGKLTIAGYSLEEIALNATFEEMMFLLWNDRLPSRDELIEFKEKLNTSRDLPDIAFTLLKQAALKNTHPMDAIKIALSTIVIDIGNTEDLDKEANNILAMKLVGTIPTIIATFNRYINGLERIQPDSKLDHAANFLYMLNGDIPDPKIVKALESYLITVADHGLNASTFVARAISSTDSDMLSAIIGAIGSLKGPKHGGAPGPALDMVFEIGSLENTETYIKNKLENNERIMGFGHRVYKVRDPRAYVLSQAARKLFTGDQKEFYDMVVGMEEIIIRLLEEYKPGRNLKTNVEFFTALVLHGCGLKPEIFSSIFAMGRVGGWTAHIFEQMKNNRLIRPRATYSGVFDKAWIPIDNR
ncbi:MAG: citrate synthase/methylcitrate synthase [Candidatus Heimdallarchaeota archaeon]|nr:citrate synthase/methylcitrate synthase [Candidatus Heimdallarchaeota archaeon]